MPVSSSSEPRYKLKPWAHQHSDVMRMVEHVEPEIGRVVPNVMLDASEPRTGKTKKVIDAAQLLFERDEIDRVLVITLNNVKTEWYHPEFGQISQNLWDGIPARVFHVHSKVQSWTRGDGERTMDWFVTNYDIVRSKDVFKILVSRVAHPRTLLVIDESAAIGGHNSLQSRHVLRIRRDCGWCWELNATPVSDSVASIFNQARTLSSAILGIGTWTDFKARYAQMGMGKAAKWIVGWHGHEELEQKLKPYVIRNLKATCLDLPPKLPPQTLAVPLSAASWRIYKDLRDEFIAELESGTVVAAQMVVRSVRLSQITSGILGGVSTVEECPSCSGTLCDRCDGLGYVQHNREEQVVGSEKLDFLKEWLETRWREQPNLKIIVWSRFKREAARVMELGRSMEVDTYGISGAQTREEREAALRAFHPATATPGPALLSGHPRAGGIGLNLAASSCVLYLSHLPSLYLYEQSRERPHGPGQTEPVAYYDVVAEGPDGQHTMDHVVLGSLRDKKELADRMTGAWVTELR